jgi:hypothetical protein
MADAHHSGAVDGVRVVGSTDRSASRCGTGMAARDAAARGRMPNTSAASTANAATSIRVDCCGNASERNGCGNDDCSMQLNILH